MPKLDKNQVDEIIKLYSEGVKTIDLAVRFSVSQPTISYHINSDSKEKTKKRAIKRFKELSSEKKKQIYGKRKEYLKGWLKNKYKTDLEWREKMKNKSREYQKKKGLSFSSRISDLQSGDMGAIPIKSID